MKMMIVIINFISCSGARIGNETHVDIGAIKMWREQDISCFSVDKHAQNQSEWITTSI